MAKNINIGDLLYFIFIYLRNKYWRIQLFKAYYRDLTIKLIIV